MGPPLVIGLGDGRALRRLRRPGAAAPHARRSCSSRTATSRRVRAGRRRASRTSRARAVARAGPAHRLGPGAGREGRLPPLHAQGDPRAAAAPCATRCSARISLEEGEVHLEELGPAAERAARGEPRRAARLRHQLARGARRQVPDRAARAAPGRGRLRQRVPLPRRRSSAPDTVAVAISQSGETADTLAAVREAKARGRARRSRSATCRARC